MTDAVQGSFPFADDFRVALRPAAAARAADMPEEAVLGLVDEGKIEAVVVNSDPASPRKHRRILANSLWAWLGRAWRFELPVKNVLRPDEFADLFDVSVRHARRLAAAGALPHRRYGQRGVLRFPREGIHAFVAARKQTEENP